MSEDESDFSLSEGGDSDFEPEAAKPKKTPAKVAS